MFRKSFELSDEIKPNDRPVREPFGRLGPDDDAPDTEIDDIKKPTTLKFSVGDTGHNRRRDVAKTEQLLGKAGTLDLKKTDGPTGFWGMRTSDAAKTFQKQNGLKIDAEINPNGPTIEKLVQITGTRDATKRRKENRENNPHKKFLQHHFEGRKKRNSPLPNSMRRADRAGFEMYPQSQNTEHQNDRGLPEVKYVHPDGREVIFDGDTRRVVDDPRIRGSFNYSNAPRFQPEDFDLQDWAEFVVKGRDHFVKDVLPYFLHGNSRKK